MKRKNDNVGRINMEKDKLGYLKIDGYTFSRDGFEDTLNYYKGQQVAYRGKVNDQKIKVVLVVTEGEAIGLTIIVDKDAVDFE
jgi:hypothetical protein